jgi:rare lipoprotein A
MVKAKAGLEESRMTAALARSGAILALGLLCCCVTQVAQANAPPAAARQSQPSRAHGTQRGKASVYSRRLAHRPMADGTPLDLDSNAAASRHLPLGSRARVTNLRNGRSAEVVIRDRGPYVKGRIIDLTPETARTLGFRSGVRRVEVTPLAGPSGTRDDAGFRDAAEAHRPRASAQ